MSKSKEHVRFDALKKYTLKRLKLQGMLALREVSTRSSAANIGGLDIRGVILTNPRPGPDDAVHRTGTVREAGDHVMRRTIQVRMVMCAEQQTVYIEALEGAPVCIQLYRDRANPKHYRAAVRGKHVRSEAAVLPNARSLSEHRTHNWVF